MRVKCRVVSSYLAMQSVLIVKNPKRDHRSSSRRAHWYPYYAGFSDDFAVSLLASLDLEKKSRVLDPWNGSGTTTLAAASLGLDAVGYDLNPVMVLVAKARLLGGNEQPSIIPLSEDIISKATHVTDTCATDEPLILWFSPSSAQVLRHIEISIQKLLVDDRVYQGVNELKSLRKISSIASFYYVALFRTVRYFLRPFFSSNPTWIKTPANKRFRVKPSMASILNQFRAEVEKMSNSIKSEDFHGFNKTPQARIDIGDSLNVKPSSTKTEVILTSPPYCTRIDYASATRAELAVLGFGSSGDYDRLRRSLIGTTTVPKSKNYIRDRWGPTCNQFLDNIEAHSSKASASYYFKNHIEYFDRIEKSVKSLASVLANSGHMFLVVQDSYYKDLWNDLPTIISEIAESHNLNVMGRYDFSHGRTMAGINRGTKQYRKTSRATESVLWVQKSNI